MAQTELPHDGILQGLKLAVCRIQITHACLTPLSGVDVKSTQTNLLTCHHLPLWTVAWQSLTANTSH